MSIFLGIIGVIVFLGLSYFIGNKFWDTFDGDFDDQLSSTLFGIGIMLAIGMVALLCYGIFYGITLLF
jgi:hypothetical protein